MMEKDYIVPEVSAGVLDHAAIQVAVDKACSTDLRTVVIPPRAEGWHLKEPVLLPDHVTVIVQDVTVYAEQAAFVNRCSDKPCALATEQEGIFVLGAGRAVIAGNKEPQIAFTNIRHFRISGIRFEDGKGVCLRHARKGILSRLVFSGSTHGVDIEEGCRELIAEDIVAETRLEAIKFHGGPTTVWGRSPEICQSSLCRLQAKTGGAPAISVDGGVEISNLILRDITDLTPGGGVSVLLGNDGVGVLQDLTVRNIRSLRQTVQINGNCDGVFVSWMQGQAPLSDLAARRILTIESEESVLPPVLRESEAVSCISANDPAYFADTDSKTLQNAVNAAKEKGAALLIPRYNMRRHLVRWDLDESIKLPSDITVVLLDAHLRLADYTYCNIFCAKDVSNVRILGVGSAQLDSGMPNGLKQKNAGLYGFGPITDNSLVSFSHVQNALFRNVAIHQSRWYGVYCNACTDVEISGVDYYAPPIFPDLGGVYIHDGCCRVFIENLSGITGEDMVHVTAEKTGVCDIHIRSLNANVSRGCMLRLCSKEGNGVSGVVLESVIDSSLPEQKKQPRAMVCTESPEVGQWIEKLNIRDIHGRGAATLELGGKCKEMTAQNIHSFGNTGYAVCCALPGETQDFQMKDTQEMLCALHRKDRTQLAACRIHGVFFCCLQASAYMCGTATSIITDKKKFVGTVLELTGLATADLVVEDVLADRVGEGVCVSGSATVKIERFSVSQWERRQALCGSDCKLLLNGELIAVTPGIKF